ncbi:MAG: hypothetical protein WBL68_02935, partial [Nitrososphaeraceae archaeon]
QFGSTKAFVFTSVRPAFFANCLTLSNQYYTLSLMSAYLTEYNEDSEPSTGTSILLILTSDLSSVALVSVVILF